MRCSEKKKSVMPFAQRICTCSLIKRNGNGRFPDWTWSLWRRACAIAGKASLPTRLPAAMRVPWTIQNGDYLIPDLRLSEQPEKPLGKYGRMRKAYLKQHRPILYNQLLMTEKLYPHLLEIDETANQRLEQMMPQLAEAAGATEALKTADPMQWVGLMNTCKAQAEEILMAELINS